MNQDNLLTTTEQLAAILVAENKALKSRDWETVRRLATEKRKAVDAYEEAVKQHDQTPLESAAADDSRLHAAADHLAMLVDENERRLTLLIFAQRRVMSAISEAVIGCNVGAGTYGRSGALSRSRGGAAPPAISLNRAF
ncbi:MAG: hypothetical protein HC826_00430 [Rhodospirillales bacterium]|nr:hypothetical protein [Rhodospirillales bacterium]